MLNTRSLFGFVAALGNALALSACTGETQIGHASRSLVNCGQDSGTVDITIDTQNCGACGATCRSNAICQHGQCIVENATCPTGFADCNVNEADGCEVDIIADITNCGTCGTICATGTICLAGLCQQPPAQFSCNGVLVDPLKDAQNCGACGRTCIPNEACVNGACVRSLVCKDSSADCDGNASNGCETNLQNDALHCGACNVVCAAVNATAVCTDGTCAIGACDAGYSNCDGAATNGCEVSLGTSANNCGACAKACATGASCVSGTCTSATGPCAANRSNCDNDTSNGCEVDLSSDQANCGACGAGCASDKLCVQGQCTNANIACNTGYADCNATLADGCEVNTATDALNCGACANVCQTGTSCVAGVCQVPAGLTLCGGVAVNLVTDPANCGGCGLVCATAPNAVATCYAGACSIKCTQGYGNCDGVTAGGCETDLYSNASNCGTCGQACATGYTCSQGSCVQAIQQCSTMGTADCNGDPADGCEANLNMSETNCGACGIVCHATNADPLCYEGTCAYLSCNTGYGDCDGNRSNFCEVNFSTDSNNCGTCNNVCANGKTCTQGTCVPQGSVCTVGYADCDANVTNGCEVNLNTDSNNCGACGIGCIRAHATSTCSGGSCTTQFCVGTYANCDGIASNGCETDVSSANAHCGACGNACATGKQCTAGVCG